MRRIQSVTLGILVCALSLPCAAQDPQGRAANADAGTPAPSEFAYVGVMGQVKNPGVYEFAAGPLLISEVIDQAGGLVDEFSGALGIIRRGLQEPFYATRLSEPIVSGDVIIAERETYPGISGRAGAQGADVDPGYKWLCFLNLLDRPAIVKMRDEHASLPFILTMLRQPRELVVNVIETGAANGLPRHPHLPTGTVLIFPLETTRYDLIPTAAVESLPLPRIAPHIAPQAPPTELAELAEPAAEEALVVVQQSTAEAAAAATAAAVTTAVSEEVEILPSPTAGQLPTINPRRRHTADEPVQVAIAEPPLVPEAIDEAALPRADVAEQQIEDYAAAIAIADTESIAAEDTVAAVEATTGSQGNMLIIVVAGVVGVLVTVLSFAALWIMIGRETASHSVALATAATAAPGAKQPIAAKPAMASAPVKASVKRVDALVKDELPVIEEALNAQLPRELHGQSVQPRKIRVDAAHSTKKPHIQPGAPTGAPAHLSLMFETTTNEMSDAWDGSIADSPAAKASVLDRVLSSVHGAKGRP